MEITRVPGLTRDELECAVDLTERLVRLRQNECKHLAIENIGPEIYAKILAAYLPPPLIYSGDIDLDIRPFQPAQPHSEQQS